MSKRMFFFAIVLTMWMWSGGAPPAAAQVAGDAVAQETPAASPPSQALTPERAAELERLGLSEDPGPDPDPEREWIRNGRRYTIQKIGREWTAAPYNKREGWIQPHHMVNMDAEIYQYDDQSVWYFLETLSKDRPKAKYRTNAAGKRIKVKPRSEEELDRLRKLRDEFDSVKPAPSAVVVTLVDGSAGLPTNGSWRNSAAVADVNGDGNQDIVAPPQRAADRNFPSIFLGDGKGGWSYWNDVRWPERPFNYGSASAGDLNRDGKVDLVFASHLDTVRVLLSDGKGGFRDSNEGLPSEYHTRRARLVDVDRDGDLDILALTEGPTRMSLSQTSSVGTDLMLFLNDGKAKAWTPVAISPPERQLGGDWMHTGDINGDKRVDVIAASIVVNGTDTIWLGGAKPAAFEPFGRGFLPFFSVYHANVAGAFSRKDRDDFIAGFSRFFPDNVDPDLVDYPENEKVMGLERIWWDGKKFNRSPIFREVGKSALFALDAGDMDGDGHLDLVYVDEARVELVLLLGSGKGTFARARFDVPDLPARRAYDVLLVDLDNDKRKDVVLLYESDESQSNGLIKVLLNRGKVKNPA